MTPPAHTDLLRATQYLLSSDRLHAHDAVEMGLANFGVPSEALIAETIDYAQRLVA